MDLLFDDVIGSKTTLFCYSIASAVLLVCLLVYIYSAKSIDDYEKIPEENCDGEDDKY